MTLQELEALKKQREEEHHKDVEALERVYRMMSKSAHDDDKNGAAKKVAAKTRKTGKGDLRDAIVEIVNGIPAEFSTQTVIELLSDKIPDLKKPSVNVVLNKLVKRGILMLTVKGIGRRPSMYRKKNQ